MKTYNKNKSPIARGIVLNFRTFGTEQNITYTAHGLFSWSIEKADFGKMTSRGWKGYIVKQGNKVAFKCNWLRDFKPTIRHLEQTFSGDKSVSSEFYDVCKTGDIWGFNSRIIAQSTIALLEDTIIRKVAKLQDIPTRKESKSDRTKRLLRAKKVQAKKIARGLI